MKDSYPEKFTVQQLIDALQKFPPDMRVVTFGRAKGFENILHPEIISVYRYEDAMPDYEGQYLLTQENESEPIDVLLISRDDSRD